MDKRSWPWKKKLGDKSLTSMDAEDVSSSKHFDDQAITELTLDHVRVSNVAVSQDQADEKVRLLNERLLAADHLVKQHVKVAEEAVSGWEKSKAENMSLKHQLEAVMEQKQVSDDRVSHLDGALKESMWQLRQIREEQEQRIHDAIVKKTRDWENSRLELQQRLADADHQLVEAEFQNSLLFKRVQEQAEVVVQLGQACSQSEAKVETLQVRVETFEKENASLKYEVMILHKELAIRNQEREINKKSLDVASRQKAESARKINKLENECQRLRALVRKKLPGPGALVQMKLEVEGLDTQRGDYHHKWRPGSKIASSPKAAESMANSEGSISDRLLAMEEETKMLKEVLSERNNELQTARIVSAQMVEKVSFLERQQVGQFQNSPRKSLLGYGLHGVDSCVSLSSYKEPSHASLSEDGVDDERSVADSWASALISELACFQKEKVDHLQTPRKSLYSQKVCDQLNSIDDFIEVERLVSLPPEQPAVVADKEKEVAAASKEALAAKEAELQAANMQCTELKSRLVLAEEQLSTLSSKNATNELNLYSLQQKLNMILENLEGGNEARAMEDVRSVVLASHCSTVDGLQAHVMKLSKASSSSVSSETPPSIERVSCQRSSSPTSDEKLPGIESELTRAVNEVVRLIEELVLEIKVQQQRNTCCEGCLCNKPENSCVHCIMTQETLEPDLIITKFKATTNQFLQGKVELVELMKELSLVLNHIRMVGLPTAHFSLVNREKQKHEVFKTAEQEVFSDAGSPFSNMSNCDGPEHQGAKVSPAGERLSTLREPRADEELRKIRAEKAALQSHMKAEFSRMDKVEEMLVQLQQEKSELVRMLEEEKEKLDATKSQLLDAEELVVKMRVRLASAEFSKNMADERLSSATAENSKLVLQLQECQVELTKSREMLRSLERSMDEENVRNEELQAKVEELQGLLERANLDKSYMEAGEKSFKEEGIANATEKLVECQRTILVLGKQIQNMASARTSKSISFNSTSYDSQGPPKDDIEKHGNGNSTVSRRKQSVRSDPGDFSTTDVTDEELVSAAKGKVKAELYQAKPSTHEEYIQAVSQQLSSSPEGDTNTQIVPYVPPKAASEKKSGALDLAKSGSSASSKRGNTFSRFFSRNKKALS